MILVTFRASNGDLFFTKIRNKRQWSWNQNTNIFVSESSGKYFQKTSLKYHLGNYFGQVPSRISQLIKYAMGHTRARACVCVLGFINVGFVLYINYCIFIQTSLKCIPKCVQFTFPNINGAVVEVWEWISNSISHFIMDVITYPSWDYNQNILRRGPGT